MKRDFMFSLILGLALYGASENSIFLSTKQPLLMLLATMLLGFLSTNRDGAVLSFAGLLIGHAIGSASLVYQIYSTTAVFNETFVFIQVAKNLAFNHGTLALWFLGFPFGFVLQSRFSAASLQDNAEYRAKVRKSSANFVQEELGESRTRPLHLALRDQPAELQTCPSITLHT